MSRDKVFDYAVMVQPLSEELGGGYYAQVPDLPGCMSDGDTPQEAFANAQDAIASYPVLCAMGHHPF